MSKTIIVSNRLPIKIQQEASGLNYQPSEGGLATGLGSIYKEGDNIWIGWPGLYLDSPVTQDEVTQDLKKENMVPVFLTKNEIEDYYEGFSNETLWPTFHYFLQFAEYDERLWEAYLKVNKKFCDTIIKYAEPGDTLWIQDYQLLLLPEMVREKLETATIGFFLHIPFPSYEVFRLLPWRKEILKGMLGSDLVGFHTYDDMRHFLSSVGRIVALSNSQGHIETGKRTMVVDSFPMGIDYDKYAASASSGETQDRVDKYRESLKDQKLIISIDRLDYSKGIPQRLKAFELFLEKYPEYRQKVTLYMVVVPSRDKVEKYKILKEEVDELVGRINGHYGRISWTPIQYFYRSFPLGALSAFYKMADVALVTPMRDGMNLVCKEYIASKNDDPGVLILSEMAGASKELSDALIINPNNINQIANGIHEALKMPSNEQKRRIRIMQGTLKKFNIHHWVNLFMDRLDYIKNKQQTLATKNIDQETIQKISRAYKQAERRLLFLDYDGTLIKFNEDPQKAMPDADLRFILNNYANDPKNKVVIISGRDKVTLQNWFEEFDLDVIGEHGVWLREQDNDWRTIEDLNNDWKAEILPVLELYVNRTPGSFIEEKDYSLVWHYRKVETGLGELRTREISSHLKYLASNINLQVLEGNMVVEIKSMEVNKGKAATNWLNKYTADFVLAIGDDWTDEDTFKVMPEHAFTVRVGSTSSSAKFNIDNYMEVRELLKNLV
ncbi:MAG: bifunctional alpha,alpha-trehalose-phosphate synthase (UDP-forming)/trehalose-phosphatase [Candidatus Cyclobacteriaceae bacterium M3_2C_046]